MEPEVEPIVEPVEEIDAVVEDTTPLEPEVEPIVEIVGFVSNCAKLNIRNKPSLDAKIVQVVNVKDHLAINLDKSTDEWFHVVTDIGTEGFCMKKFVTMNR